MRIFARAGKRETGETGFTILEVLIVLVIISLIAAIAIPIYANALTKSRRAALVSDLRVLKDAMKRYYSDKGRFPVAGGDPSETLDLATLAPLSTGEYFSGVEGLNSKLAGNRIAGYAAFNNGGTATEYLAVMVPRYETDIVVALLYRNNGGVFQDGIFFNIGGTWIPAEEAI